MFFLMVVLLKCIGMILNGVIDSTEWKQMMYNFFKMNATNNAIFSFFLQMKANGFFSFLKQLENLQYLKNIFIFLKNSKKRN